VTPAARRQVVTVLTTEHPLSVRRACRVVGLARAAWYRPPQAASVRDGPVIEALQQVVRDDGRWGFWKCFDSLRLLGHRWNHKRVWQVPPRVRRPLIAPMRTNAMWAMDFVHDALYGGRPFRTLNVLDEGNREALAIEVGTALPSGRVIRVLEQLIALHGRPAARRLDNGPELTAQAFTDWCRGRRIAVHHIQQGKPTQDAFIERFNRTYREEVLDAYLFESLDEVQRLADDWLTRHNTVRPHDALGRVPPLTYLPREILPPKSTNP